MYLGPSLVTIIALIVYQVVAINVGRARMKFKIMPPATTGDPEFDRVLRVQQNTLEQLVFFLPLLWLFSYYVSPMWGTGIGFIWVLGRILYALGYYQAPEKRTLGFGVSSISAIVLLIGALVGIILSGVKLFS